MAAKQIEAVPSSDEMRVWHYLDLEAISSLSLFPRRYATQKALAQFDMVQWLTFSTELGRVPDEIQLMMAMLTCHRPARQEAVSLPAASAEDRQ